MRYFAYNLGPTPIAFDEGLDTPKFLMAIKDNRVGVVRVDSEEWPDDCFGWTVDEVLENVNNGVWIEVAPENMFKFLNETH